MSKDLNVVIRMQFDLYGCIARLYENLKKGSSFANITIGMIQARLEALEDYWAKFKAQHYKLATSWEDLSGHDYFKKNIYALTEESYLSQKAMFLDALRTLKNKASVEASAVGANPSQPLRITLPRIQLPQFSGLYEDWSSFRDFFHSNIGKNVSIAPVEKLHYLKACLKGEAELLIRRLPITDENFDHAWKTLTDYYENELIRSYISSFTAIQKLKDESAANLHQNVRADIAREGLAQGQKLRTTEEGFGTRTAQIFNENVHEADITLPVQRGSDQNEKVSTAEQEEVIVLAENHAKSSSERKKVKRKKKSSANNSKNINRKKNQGRANKKQIKTLITYLEQHPNLVSGKFSTSDNQEKLQNDWEKLVRYLNKFRLNGKKKDVKSWKHTWRDLRYKVSKKVEKLQKNGATIENNLIEMNLTELENKILKIMNYKCLKGLTIVPDFPEEHNNAIKKLRAGKLESSSNYMILRNL